METVKMFRPYKWFGALVALLVFQLSAPAARADIKWTLDDVVLDGGSLSFFTADVTGTFLQTSKGYTPFTLTAAETYLIDDTQKTITYTFSGPPLSPLSQPSQYPPPPCILLPCDGGAGDATLYFEIGPLVALPGTYSAEAALYDGGHTASYCAAGHLCEVIATSVPAPEPSFWVLGSMSLAGVGFWAMRMHRRRHGVSSSVGPKSSV